VVYVCVSLCVFGTRVSCAKAAEPIAMPFWELTHVGPRYHVLNGGSKSDKYILRRKGVEKRCGLLPNYFGHLFLIPFAVEVISWRMMQRAVSS